MEKIVNRYRPFAADTWTIYFRSLYALMCRFCTHHRYTGNVVKLPVWQLYTSKYFSLCCLSSSNCQSLAGEQNSSMARFLEINVWKLWPFSVASVAGQDIKEVKHLLFVKYTHYCVTLGTSHRVELFFLLLGTLLFLTWPWLTFLWPPVPFLVIDFLWRLF